MKIFTGEELKNPYPLFPRDHYESNTDGGRAMQIDEGRHEMWEKCKLSILNQCVEVGIDRFHSYLIVNGITVATANKVRSLLEQFSQSEIKKQEGENVS